MHTDFGPLESSIFQIPDNHHLFEYVHRWLIWPQVWMTWYRDDRIRRDSSTALQMQHNLCAFQFIKMVIS